jgi:hypothetical protein
LGLFRRRRDKAPESVESVPAEVDARATVVPLLVGRAWLDGNEQTFGQIPNFPAEAYPFARTLADGLWASYATDPAGSWQQVQRGQVDAFGGPEGLHDAALANLRRRVSGQITTEGGGGRFRLTVPHEMDLSASLALVPELWTGGVEIAGAPVLCLPTRVELLVCGDRDEETVASLRTFAPSLMDEARGKPVAPTLFTLTDAGIAALA